MADLEDALKKLDRLTQEEARMALVEVLRIAHNVRDKVKVVDGRVESVGDYIDPTFVRRADQRLVSELSSSPLAFLSVSLHDENGQEADIAEYVRSVVNFPQIAEMRRWREDDKNLVIETLTERADGM